MKRTGRLFMIVVSSILALQATAGAWNHEVTHPDISHIAARNSVVFDKSYLESIGLTTTNSDPLEEELAGSTIGLWIRNGAKQEDAGSAWDAAMLNARYLNHFHNPLMEASAWSRAGLFDQVSGYSLIEWAQSVKQLNYPEGDHSWMTARESYLLALSSPSEATRREYFARVFMDLGFQMHLIQDSSVPEHVRNDNHAIDSAWESSTYDPMFFETWAKQNPAYVNEKASTPVFPAVDLHVSRSSILAPITQLVDTESYTGENPSQSTSLAWGLAEYTNANFFSDDTVFAADDLRPDDIHYFPYPRKSSTNYQAFIDKCIIPETTIAIDGEIENCPYIIKERDGQRIDHFLRPSYHTLDLEGISCTIFDRAFYRDTRCKKDYIKLLIPRAVGYSAALINYFFRGRMDLLPSDPPSSGYVIRNNTDESMLGELHLFYDNNSGSRVEILGGSFPVASASIPANGRSGNLSFPTPTDAKKPGEYMLVFRGFMGNEAGAVAGAMVKSPMLLLTIDPGSFALGNTDERIADYIVVLDANIQYLNGWANYWLNMYNYYISINQGLQAANALEAYQGFSVEWNRLVNEKLHWAQFCSAINEAADAPTRFIAQGGSTQTDFTGALADLTAHYHAAYLNQSSSPTWTTMPSVAKTHTFITAPSSDGNPMLLLMFSTKAGMVPDSQSATILCRSFYFSAPYILSPQLTVTIDGIPWIQGPQGSWTTETNDVFSLDEPHHVEVRMSASVIDGSRFPNWNHTKTMELELFWFDFTITKE